MSEDSYTGVKARLEEISKAVDSDDISLDDALSMYEEAVKLSLAACDLSESDLRLESDEDAEVEVEAEAEAATSADDEPISEVATEDASQLNSEQASAIE